MPAVRKGPKVAKIKPFGKYLIVVPTKPKTEINGIVLPEDAIRPSLTGRIAEVGPEVPKDAGYEKGQMVLFSQYAGLELDLEDIEGVGDSLKILAIPYEQVIAKVDLAD